MLYPCSCNVLISYWKSGAYGNVICRGGTDLCFVPGSEWKHLDLEQYLISGLTHTNHINGGSHAFVLCLHFCSLSIYHKRSWASNCVVHFILPRVWKRIL